MKLINTSSHGHIPVPVCQCHHDVQGSQEKHEVEERVAVGDSILLIVNGTVGAITHFKVLWSGTILDQSRLVAGEGQFVHLGVARVANAEEIKTQIWLLCWKIAAKTDHIFEHMQTLLPGVQHTQQEQDQAHNTLGIPPLNNTVWPAGVVLLRPIMPSKLGLHLRSWGEKI